MGTGGRDASALRQAKRDGRGSAAWRVKGASRRERQRQRSGVRSKGEPASPSPSCILSSSPRGSSVLHRADGRRLWLGFKAQLSVRLACPESRHGPARAPPALPLAAACVPRPPPPAAAGGPAPPGSAAPTCRAPAARRRQLPPPRAKGASGAGRGGAGGAGAGTGPGPAGPPPRQSPLSARPAGAATPPAPSRLHPLQRLVRGSAAGPGGGGGRLFAFVAAPESRNPAPLGRPEAGPRAPRRFGRALVFYGPRADRCACRSAFPWRRPVLRRQTVKLHFRAEGERGEAGRVVLVCGRKRDTLRHPAAPREDTMPCRVGEEVGGGFALELPPHLEFPQGKEMYAWFYNPAPALLNFST